MQDQRKCYIRKMMVEGKPPNPLIMLNNIHKKPLLDWRKQQQKKKRNREMNLKHLILLRLPSKSSKSAMLWKKETLKYDDVTDFRFKSCIKVLAIWFLQWTDLSLKFIKTCIKWTLNIQNKIDFINLFLYLHSIFGIFKG